MILVTVGTDSPFDRLVKAVDSWCADNSDEEVFAQIGKTNMKPINFPFCNFMKPPEFKRVIKGADFVISHAGMGTILTSLQYQKPLLVMPRIAELGEHRNEHQLATAKYLKLLDRVNVADDVPMLITMLDRLKNLPTKGKIGPYASISLTKRLRDFIINVS